MKLRKNKTLYIAHRGSESAMAVENTLKAYIGGAEDHYDGLECDIQITKDNKYVCYHNLDMLEHSKNEISGTIADYTLDELKKMVIYDIVQKKEVEGEICLFEEYLDVLKKHNIYGLIELKNCPKFFDNNFEHIINVMKIVEEKGLINQVSIISFVPEFLYFLRDKYKNLHLQLVYDKKVTKDLTKVLFEKRINIDLRFDKVNPVLIHSFHKNNLEFNAWTVNYRIVGAIFKSWNIDMITSDVLKKPKRYLKKENNKK